MTLADHLRALSDEDLGTLLQLRPDLTVPPPADLSQLASRVQSRVSVARALDGLDRFTLQVLDGLRYVRGDDAYAPAEKLLTLAAEAGAEPAKVRDALTRLRQLQLIYGDSGQVRLLGAIDELTASHPVGLGRPAEELVATNGNRRARGAPIELVADPVELAADPAGLRRMLLSAPPEARAVLDRLAAGPPIGQVQLKSTVEGSPVRWLVEHGLLVAVADDLVELPREVGWLRLHRPEWPGVAAKHQADLEGRVRPGADSAGAGQAMEAVRHLDALLSAIADAPPPVLKTYGLGVRELRRLAKECGISEATCAMLLEIAQAAALLTGHAEGPGESVWLPTPAYDMWRAGSIARQWALLARTWLGMTRAPALVGQRDDRDKVINALSHDVAKASAPAVRRAVLGVLADQSELIAVDPEALLDRLAWQLPRRFGRASTASAEQASRPGGPGARGSSAVDLLARSALREAAELGVTGLDALTAHGRVLLREVFSVEDDEDPLGIRGDGDPLVATLDRLLPPPVDHVLVQADLTVVVPGPPEPALSAELAALADAESRGGATVYRVTPTSVRRGLDAGYAPADIHELFRRRSRTPLPQTLSYLIDDVARRHGGLRVGAVGSYLRSDDENLIAEVLADRRLAGLSLRRLAPTVLACQHSRGRLLDQLRGAGYVPVAEDASGAVVLTRPVAPRATGWTARPRLYVDDPDRQRLTGPRLAAMVEQIRRGERIARAARRSPLAKRQVGADGQPVTATQAHAQALAVLRQGITERKLVWVGFVDAHGSTGSRLVRPVSMGGGFLHAEDDRNQTRHTFALHRITAAAIEG